MQNIFKLTEYLYLEYIFLSILLPISIIYLIIFIIQKFFIYYVNKLFLHIFTGKRLI
jgi:hypothetical protein